MPLNQNLKKLFTLINEQETYQLVFDSAFVKNDVETERTRSLQFPFWSKAQSNDKCNDDTPKFCFANFKYRFSTRVNLKEIKSVNSMIWIGY